MNSHIEMRPINSSNIASASYDAETEVLDVVFTNGNAYSYDGVPKDIGDGLFTSTSAGTYFHNNIKGRFRFYRG